MASTNVFDQTKQDVFELAKKFKIPEEKINQFIEPNRIVETNLRVVMDDKSVKLFKAYRSQHNNKLGPYKGGIRFHPQVTKEEVMALSVWMSLKCAVAGIPLGGGKGGIIVDPKALSEKELEHLSREYVRKIYDVIGASKDVPAPDVNTNPTIMKWMVDEYIKLAKEEGKAEDGSLYATFTGKPLEHKGLAGRTEATGFGGVVVLKELIKKLGKNPKDLTVAIQGFGNVGYYFATLSQHDGFQVVAVSDSKGGIVNEDNGQLKALNIQTVFESKKKEGKLSDQNSKSITNEELLELPVDVLVPSALESVITEKNMKKIKAKIIIEMANGPVTPEAHEYLSEQGVIIVPDILANAGGVSGSYIEWKQNIANETFEKDVVLKDLEELMKKAFEKVWEEKTKHESNIKEAAYLVALSRLLD